MKGYDLHKSGSRVNELLERQFIVPTLNTIPNKDTLSWQDGTYNTSFRIGEFCRVKKDNHYEFYRLDDIENGIAIWRATSASSLPEGSDYYTKEETNNKIYEELNKIALVGESIKNVTQQEYNNIVATGQISDNILYFVKEGQDPIALYIGTVLIAQKEEGQKGFTYNFPIIF